MFKQMRLQVVVFFIYCLNIEREGEWVKISSSSKYVLRKIKYVVKKTKKLSNFWFFKKF